MLTLLYPYYFISSIVRVNNQEEMQAFIAKQKEQVAQKKAAQQALKGLQGGGAGDGDGDGDGDDGSSTNKKGIPNDQEQHNDEL